MSAQRQTQPTASRPRKPTFYHWVQHGSDTALCGKEIPPASKKHGPAGHKERTMCNQCETLRLMENDLNW